MSEIQDASTQTVELTESSKWSNESGSQKRIPLTESDYNALEELNNEVERTSRYNENSVLKLWRDNKPQFDGNKLGFKWESNSVVGVIGLPSGLKIQILPDIPAHRLGWLLQYGKRIEPVINDKPTKVGEGAGFIDAVAALYTSELTEALRSGLDQNYGREIETRSAIRGQISFSNQLRQEEPGATKFVCRHSNLTYDTPLNHALLEGLTAFRGHVTVNEIEESIVQLENRIGRHISREHVDAADLDRVSLNRLNERYRDAFRLARYIIQNQNVGGYGVDAESFSILFSLSTVFEEVGRRALMNGGLIEGGFAVSTQQARRLTSQGDYKIIPDILIRDEEGDVVGVGDVKWKISREPKPDRNDRYQMISYQATESAPGLLIYPDQNRSFDPMLDLVGNDPLYILEIPVREEAPDYSTYVSRIQESAREKLSSMLDPVSPSD